MMREPKWVCQKAALDPNGKPIRHQQMICVEAVVVRGIIDPRRLKYSKRPAIAT